MARTSPPGRSLLDIPEPNWTPREREVLDLLVRGRTNAQVAEALGISLAGAKWHVSEVISKLGVESREEAAEYWRARNGLRLRFTRALRALLPGAGWLKVGGAVAGLAAVSAAVVVVVALKESGGEERVLADATPRASTSASPAATAPPTIPPNGAYPPGSSTGIPGLHAVITTLTSGDVAAVKRILVETPSPCVVNPQGITSPPKCPDGVGGGTLLPVFRATAGEAVWPSELDQVLQNSVPIEHWLYGVYRTDSYVGTDSYVDRWIPTGEYGVIVGDETRSRMAGYFITASGIVGARFMGWSPGQGATAILPLRPSTLPPTPTPVPQPPVVSSAIGSWYPLDTRFTMTDLFDLQRIPQVAATTWPQVSTPNGNLSVRYPAGWTATSSNVGGSSAVQIRKPLQPGQVVLECRTVPGYIYADLNADPSSVDVSSAGATIVRDVLVRVMTNGLTVRVIQAANICGTDQGDLVLAAQPPFPGKLVLNGAVAVHFPATAEDIATAFAVIGSVAIK